ncbi:MAG TPA: DNA polymerase [Candidatus Limiplasma sp.]|nr:DNA polymerase [Candidatus Limiplasma sp.]
MHQLSIDIETYSGLDINDVGLYRYANSPEFRVLLIGVAVDDGPVRVIDLAQTDATESRHTVWADFLSWFQRADVTLHAFNAVFEWYCLGRIGLATPVSRWRCTMVHGLYLGYSGGLAAMGAAVGIDEDKQKLKTGKTLIKRFSCPDTHGRRVLPEQEPEKWQMYQEYNRNDVEAERALEKRFSPWPLPESEQKLWEQDALLNAGGIRVERQLVEAARTVWADEKADLLTEAVQISGLNNPNSTAQLKAWITAELDSDTPVSIRKEDVKDLLKDATTPDTARRMLEIRQRLGKTSVSKYDALAALTSPEDSRVRGLLQFYGAHTGRWSGRGIQVHNLPKPSLTGEALEYARNLLREGGRDPLYTRQALTLCFGNLPDTLSQLIRTVLVPAPGNRFIVADFSAIEARVVAWLAGETWVNEVFATHGKIYEAAASQMFGVPLDTIRKGQANYALRSKGKVATLALGYGGGPGALVNMGALKMGLTEDELPDIVTRWRNANSHIKRLWYELQDASVAAVKTGARRDVKGLRFWLETSIYPPNDRYLTVDLPAGRQLFYPAPRIDIGDYGNEELAYKAQGKGGFIYTRAWGGTLTENVVQAIARDCLAEVLRRIAARMAFGPTEGIRFHVHDEVIVEVTAETADARLDELLAMMAEPINWAPGLLLKGDGFITDYYRKD